MATTNKNKTLSYSHSADYENKLDRVMKRLNVEKFTFNYDRQGNSYVEFWYKGSMYRFEHSIEKAAKHGITLKKGSDAFAQIVLSLEDLARMVERGIYDLQVWVKGMAMLPEAKEIPSFIKYLGFSEIPQTVDEIKAKYREQSKLMHPDAGGNIEDSTYELP
jgi:hypothetical protein